MPCFNSSQACEQEEAVGDLMGQNEGCWHPRALLGPHPQPRPVTIEQPPPSFFSEVSAANIPRSRSQLVDDPGTLSLSQAWTLLAFCMDRREAARGNCLRDGQMLPSLLAASMASGVQTGA